MVIVMLQVASGQVMELIATLEQRKLDSTQMVLLYLELSRVSQMGRQRTLMQGYVSTTIV